MCAIENIYIAKRALCTMYRIMGTWWGGWPVISYTYIDPVAKHGYRGRPTKEPQFSTLAETIKW